MIKDKRFAHWLLEGFKQLGMAGILRHIDGDDWAKHKVLLSLGTPWRGSSIPFAKLIFMEYARKKFNSPHFDKANIMQKRGWIIFYYEDHPQKAARSQSLQPFHNANYEKSQEDI